MVAITATSTSSLALRYDGTLWAWGDDHFGQLTYNSPGTNSNLPIRLPLNDVTAIAGAVVNFVALTNSGAVYTWGGNQLGSLGQPLTVVSSSFPAMVAGLKPAVAIAAGFGTVYALQNDGTVAAWGEGDYGELGIGTAGVQAVGSPTPVTVTGLAGIVSIGAGANVGYAIKADGTVYSWGLNNYGVLGDGNYRSTNLPVVSPNLQGTCFITGGVNAIHAVGIAPSRSLLSMSITPVASALAVNSSQTLRATGYYSDGTTQDLTSSVTWLSTDSTIAPLTGNVVRGLRSGAARVVATLSGVGSSASIKVAGGGQLLSWGLNSSGQLGDGTTTTQTTPVAVQKLNGMVAVAAGSAHSLAVKADGTVWAWGQNTYGQLGNGSNTMSLAPVQVPGLTQVVAVAAGKFHSLALRADGTVWAWGYNADGELGIGTTANSASPVQVAGVPVILGIAAGSLHSLALGVDGRVWTWGSNAHTQLGYGFNGPYYAPYSAVPIL
jgi:alpha-tubulin suppressor-like RCC1 family protein